MANEKQRRRRAKEKRHAYDLVEIDEEGNETVLTASELKAAEGESKPKKGKGTASGRSSRGGRGAPPPASWQRVLKRAMFAGPGFFALVLILGGGKVSLASAALNMVFLLAIFIPFSYVLDGFVHRSYQKRLAKTKSR